MRAGAAAHSGSSCRMMTSAARPRWTGSTGAGRDSTSSAWSPPQDAWAFTISPNLRAVVPRRRGVEDLRLRSSTSSTCEAGPPRARRSGAAGTTKQVSTRAVPARRAASDESRCLAAALDALRRCARKGGTTAVVAAEPAARPPQCSPRTTRAPDVIKTQLCGSFLLHLAATAVAAARAHALAVVVASRAAPSRRCAFRQVLGWKGGCSSTPTKRKDKAPLAPECCLALSEGLGPTLLFMTSPSIWTSTLTPSAETW